MIYDKILLSYKNGEILPLVTTCKDLEGLILSEISEIEKKSTMLFYSYVKYKNKTNT